MKKKRISLSLIICIVFLVTFILDFFVFVYPNTNIFSVNHLINGNEWGYLTEYGRLINITRMNGEFWRIFTSIFLHAGIVHLAINIIVLIVVGSKIESIIKCKYFLLVFILGGVLSSVGTMFWTNGSVGASGSIYALIGFLIVSLLKKEISFKDFKIVEIIILLIYLIVPNFSARTAILSHLFGTIIGIIFGVVILKNKERSDIDERKIQKKF